MASLFELQLKQRKHDERYHRDIFYLNHQERFEHFAFHLGKYTARLARVEKKMRSGDSRVSYSPEKDFTDSFIMLLNAGEMFNLDYEELLRRKYGLQGRRTTLSSLTNTVKAKKGAEYKWTRATNKQNQLLGILLDIADCSGVIHKACDSLDHMEGLDRKQITETLLDLLVILLLAAQCNDISFEKTVPSRWKEIEKGKIL